MASADEPLHEISKTDARENRLTVPSPPENGKPVRIEPDLQFIHRLRKLTGNSFEKCFQCGTCSSTCTLSPEPEPFPRKEMAWANWGMKDQLLRDPDVWLCYQCNDCSTRCPRSARPGDLLAAVRQEDILHYSFPRFFARWVNQPQCIPLLLGIPIVLLTLALYLKDPIEKTLGISGHLTGGIVYSYSSMFPHWLLNSFFLFFTLLVLIVATIGVVRFWLALKSNDMSNKGSGPAKSLFPSIIAALKSIITHDNFSKCTKSRSRYISHMSVFFGFVALTLVTIWVITARYNPLVQNDFVYPFSFWYPWKILANLGGAALLAGCFLMILDRFKDDEQDTVGTYFDWALIATLFIVVLTGFLTEILHYVRLEPHRHIAYFIHLAFVCALLLYLPYSKLAHLIYRTTAMVYAEHTGRIKGTSPLPVAKQRVVEKEAGSNA